MKQGPSDFKISRQKLQKYYIKNGKRINLNWTKQCFKDQIPIKKKKKIGHIRNSIIINIPDVLFD